MIFHLKTLVVLSTLAIASHAEPDASCNDSPIPFDYAFRENTTCESIAGSSRPGKTPKSCVYYDVWTHCRSSCNKCDTCVDSMNGNIIDVLVETGGGEWQKATKGCDYVRSFPGKCTKSRSNGDVVAMDCCRKSSIRNTCPETCGVCSSATKDPTPSPTNHPTPSPTKHPTPSPTSCVDSSERIIDVVLTNKKGEFVKRTKGCNYVQRNPTKCAQSLSDGSFVPVACCRNPSVQYVQDLCPKTCGMCSAPGSCEDAWNPNLIDVVIGENESGYIKTTKGCSFARKFPNKCAKSLSDGSVVPVACCTNPSVEYVQDLCPETCGMCSAPGSCEDAWNPNLIDVAIRKTVGGEYVKTTHGCSFARKFPNKCAKSLSDGSVVPVACCTDPSVQYIQDLCPKTCGLCSAPEDRRQLFGEDSEELPGAEWN